MSGPGATLSATTIRESSLLVEGTASILPNGGTLATSRVNTLSIDGTTDAWTGKLDLADNDLIIDYTGASPISTVRNQIKTGFNNGAWTGKGITTSVGSGARALGYADNAASGLATFSGQSIDSTCVLVKYTYSGDANLDGKVDVTDLGALATNWQAAALWTGGDFNYDGVVNVTDLGALATNWQAGVSNPLGPANFGAALASLGLGGASVPEPVALYLFAGVLMSVPYSSAPSGPRLTQSSCRTPGTAAE